MEQSISFEIYKYKLLSLNQSTRNGIRNYAKPLLILSIIDCVDNNVVSDNMLYFEKVNESYNRLNKDFDANITTRCQYPFYFLQSDGFYYLKWKGTPIITRSPSAKMLKENVEYAYLDSFLWDLLQDKNTRELYKKLIIENHLTK